jgi:hypothetical protein
MKGEGRRQKAERRKIRDSFCLLPFAFSLETGA